jgi:predicted lysophospholipase L1 biosynthesis ABC-type transport system permease subunit
MNSTEFEELGIKVGDKVTVDIEICNNDIGI